MLLMKEEPDITIPELAGRLSNPIGTLPWVNTDIRLPTCQARLNEGFFRRDEQGRPRSRKQEWGPVDSLSQKAKGAMRHAA